MEKYLVIYENDLGAVNIFNMYFELDEAKLAAKSLRKHHNVKSYVWKYVYEC